MQSIRNSFVISISLLLFVIQVSHAQFMCYVCEDCAKITTDTPLVDCDAGFFSTTGTTLPSTQTTTKHDGDTTTGMTTITTSTTSDTTDAITTTVQTTETPMSTTTQITTTTTKLPLPPTIGPVETTVPVPTPPNIGTAETIAADLEDIVLLNATTALPINVRQRRQAGGDDYTYHCYSVQKQVNGTWQTDRGCSRVTTMEDVCIVLQEANNDTKLNKCIPCTNTRCNGSATLALSMLAMVLGVIATSVLKWQ